MNFMAYRHVFFLDINHEFSKIEWIACHLCICEVFLTSAFICFHAIVFFLFCTALVQLVELGEVIFVKSDLLRIIFLDSHESLTQVILSGEKRFSSTECSTKSTK